MVKQTLSVAAHPNALYAGRCDRLDNECYVQSSSRTR